MTIASLILLFCCMAGSQCACLQGPVGQLPEGCENGNLIVTSSSFSSIDNVKIVDEVSCNRKIPSKYFLYPPDVVVLRRYNDSTEFTSNATYLLTVVDLTNKKLIWMVSNVTVITGKTRVDDFGEILPLAMFNTHNRHILRYHRPDSKQKNIRIQFLVFEEGRNNASSSYIATNTVYDSPFHLLAWIDAQKSSGITICGPVAGGSVIVVGDFGSPNFHDENLPPYPILKSDQYPDNIIDYLNTPGLPKDHVEENRFLYSDQSFDQHRDLFLIFICYCIAMVLLFTRQMLTK